MQKGILALKEFIRESGILDWEIGKFFQCRPLRSLGQFQNFPIVLFPIIMSNTLTVELKGLRFYAYHGLYAEEKKTGNEFEVNLSVSFEPQGGTITDISDTVNYSKLYTLVRSEMQKPRHLLETFVMELAEMIHLSYPRIRSIDISITKLHV